MRRSGTAVRTIASLGVVLLLPTLLSEGAEAARVPKPRTTTTTTAPATTTTTAPATTTTTTTPPATTTTTTPATTTTTAPSPPATKRVYAYYYLWWSTKHWYDKLGPSYSYGSSPLPLPATLDAAGCTAVSLFPGNQLTDVPATLYTQDEAAIIERHVRQAAAAGLTGFLVNWAGTGAVDQTPTSVSYSRRLDAMFTAVRKVNAEGIPFKIVISYKVAHAPTADQIANDFAYLVRQYGNDAAYDHSYSSRPVLFWTGSRKYVAGDVASISARFRPNFFIVGDETAMTWGDGRSAHLDGNSYYWSTQNPHSNPRSFDQLKSLAATVRASGANPDGSRKLWFAPFTPGYNSQLLATGSTCVPRNGGETMRLLFDGNSASSPDGWTFISWNEIAEGTYVEPMQRYGSQYLDLLGSLIRGS